MRDPDPIISDLARTRPGDLVVLGAPWEGGSSYLPGTAGGPTRIREALLSPARSLATEAGADLAHEDRCRFLGDLSLANQQHGARSLQTSADEVLKRGGRLLTLGGDHSITVGLVRAFAHHFSKLTLVQIDAHPDLYEQFQGDRWSHACPMARILEEGLVDRLVQVGIRAMTPEQRALADRHAVEVVERTLWQSDGIATLGLRPPLYVSVDLDGLDPAFAPGVSHPEPGGLSTRQTLDILQELPGPIVGADLVELNPTQDPQGLTAVVASKLVKELAARLLEGAAS